MNTQTFFLSLLICLSSSVAQARIVEFDDITLSADSFNIGHPDGDNAPAPFSTGSMNVGDTYDVNHTSNGINFPVHGEVFGGGFTYFAWEGWAMSNKTDTVTAGFGNQYSAYPGIGAGGSSTYGIAFTGGGALPSVQIPVGSKPISIDIANTTYAALSMLVGDAFADPFGGPSGTEPDQFTLTISGNNGSGSVDFLLADYSFANPLDDYVLDGWTSVDITSLEGATELTFDLFTTDIGDFGPNTPLYFAADNLALVEVLGDTDGDDDIDLDDIIAAVGNFTGPNLEPTPPTFGRNITQGDVDGDEDVDLDDIIAMVGGFTGPLDSAGPAAGASSFGSASAFGGPSYQLTSASSAVPEPSTWVLAAFGLLGLIGIGWRRNR